MKKKYLVTFSRRVVETVTVMYEATSPEQALQFHKNPQDTIGWPYVCTVGSARTEIRRFGKPTVKLAPPICDDCKRQCEDEPACESCIPY